jgi:predicted ATPase/Tfp pilus assembly protein PilF
MLEVRLLGQFDVRLNDDAIEIPSRPAQTLFAYLILNPGVAHRREMLAGMLWPDSTESNARGYLRHALWRIRKALPDDYLLVDNMTIAYNSSLDYWLDVSVLERSLVEGVSSEQLAEEVSVYKGELLPGFYDDWIVPHRERLQSRFEHKMDAVLAALVAEGQWREVLEYGENWIALGHAPEPAYRALMEAHSSLGNRAGIVAAYERCVDSLQNELGVSPSDMTRSTYDLLLKEQMPPNGLAVEDLESDVRLDIVALQTTPFIGRQNELAEITNRLEDPTCRLLTLIGPGGIGKTCLVLELARQLNNHTYFVPLSSIPSSSLLVPTIAESLGLSFYGGQDPKARLLDHLRKTEALLVLDSFEHLLDSVDLLVEILRSGPAVKILATSRQRLNLHSEWLFEVAGMDFPHDSQIKDVETYSAVQLFLQTARRLDPGFSLVDEDRPYLVRICQLVEGMPLAIELAAGWVRMLSCREIAHELENSLDFLAASLRDIPERHQSLRAVFEHSWSLLSENERETFRKLTIFRGGVNRESAAKVTGTSLLTLSSLADKSLLRWTPTGRYQIHQTLATYGEEILAEHPTEKSVIGDLHCTYYAEFVQQQHANLQSGRQKEALQAMEGEIDNIRAAWNWAIEHSRVEETARTLDGLHAFYQSRGWFEEGDQSIDNAIDHLRSLDQEDPDKAISLTLGKALTRRGSLSANLGHYDDAKSQLLEGLSLMRELQAMQEVTFALNALGGLAWDLGEYGEAMQYHRESVAICREAGYRPGLSESLDNLGFVSLSLGQLEEAKRLLLESVEIARETGNQMGVASPLGRLGWVAYVEGELDKAQAYFKQAIAISENFDNRMVKTLDQAGLSLTMNALHQYENAKNLAEESLAAARDIGYQLAIVVALGSLAEALRVEGNYQKAHICLQEGFKITIGLGLLPMHLLLLIVWGSLLADEGESERATEVLSLIFHSAGEVATFGQVAQSRLLELEAELSPEVFSVAKQRGEEASLDRLVQEIVEQD